MKPSEVIQERGWIQGDNSSPSGVCMGEAICVATHGERCCAGSHRLWDTIDKIVGELTWWNDRPERTKEQVIALLKEYETEFHSDVVAAPKEEVLA